MSRISSFKSWLLWIIFFGLPLFQVITGYGLVFSGWIVGIFPSIIIYFLWLYSMLTQLKEKNRYVVLRSFLISTSLVILPVYNLLINEIDRNSPMVVIITTYGGITFLVLITLMILSWNAISKLTWYYINSNKSNYDLIDFSSYKILFLKFVGGPITFIFLQREIKKGIQRKNSIRQK